MQPLLVSSNFPLPYILAYETPLPTVLELKSRELLIPHVFVYTVKTLMHKILSSPSYRDNIS